MPFTVGTQVGPYRILAPLGQGGMATVFKAYHAALDRYVAIKVLHPALLEDPNFLARFRREARVVAKLDHPNIVPIYDFSEHQGHPYLVMKYIEGETLKARMKRGPLTPEEIRAVVEAVGSALAYAHRQGVLHRDIKPSNVLLSQDGRIYLSDFGLARMAASGESTLSADMIMGTPQYISPEQAMGKKDLDARTDIYSFGVMLYEMIVGRVPYMADTPYSIIHDHIYAPLPRPRDLNPQVPEAIERVLLKALAKAPEDRFESVEALLRAFREAWEVSTLPSPTDATLAAPPAEASAPPPPSTGPLEEAAPPPKTIAPPKEATPSPEAEAPSKRRRWWLLPVGLIGVGLLCLLALGAFNAVRHRQAASTPAPRETLRPAAQATTLLDYGIAPDDAEAQALLRAIQDNPNDPLPYLELALLQYRRQRPRLGDAPLERGLNLAVRFQQSDLLTDYALQFMELGAPLPAARLLLAARPLLPPEQREQWNDLFRQAAYLAAEDPAFERFLSTMIRSKFDQPFTEVVRARYELYNGDPERGYALLEEVLQKKGNMPEALLLQAEYAALAGQDPVLARRALERLLNTTKTPDWILEAAKEMLALLPTPQP